MPTTQEEAAKIIEISQEFMSFDKLAELYKRLDEEVGKKSDNDSLKTSLQMMRAFMEHKLAQIVKEQEQNPRWTCPFI